MTRKRPIYLQNQDLVQDAIEEHGRKGVTIQKLMVLTNLSYAAVQQATANLRIRDRIHAKTKDRKLHFYPRPSNTKA